MRQSLAAQSPWSRTDALSYLSGDWHQVGQSYNIQNARCELRSKCPEGVWVKVCSIQLKAMELLCYSWVSSKRGLLLPPAVKRPVRLRYASLCKFKLIQCRWCPKRHVIVPSCVIYQKKRQKRNSTMIVAMPAIGPYCFRSSSQLMRTAARLYLAESSRRRLLMSPILSRLSPR